MKRTWGGDALSLVGMYDSARIRLNRSILGNSEKVCGARWGQWVNITGISVVITTFLIRWPSGMVTLKVVITTFLIPWPSGMVI